MNYKTGAITIPDLRFEQSFLRSLDRYAADKQSAKATLSKAELELSDSIDDGIQDQSPAELTPLAPITPGIVAYAVIKDQIVMPLLQGFLWSGLLLCVRPMLALVVANGQRWGTWVSSGIGISARKMK